MIKSIYIGLFLVPLFIILQSGQKAEAIEITLAQDPITADTQQLTVAQFEVPLLAYDAEIIEETKKTVPDATQYTVIENDSLVKIAEKHGTTWKRIFDKNTIITHPDFIKPGDLITIPHADESLSEREMPELPVATSLTPRTAAAQKATMQKVVAKTLPAGSSTGNKYVPGYCTWYVKNKRPSLPNNLGNASSWVSNAAAQGMATGSIPRAGAVGQRGMHVVYVESVNGDGTVNISEMNHKGLYVMTSRTLPANYFTYIY